MTEDRATARLPRQGASLGEYARMPQVRLGALVVLAVLVGLVLWLAFGRDNSKTAKPAPATAATPASLRSLAASVRHPVYWAGARAGFKYELTRTADGRIYIRYLPAGVAIGDTHANYLAIGTYPVKDAVAAVKGIAKREKTSTLGLSGGGVAVQDRDHPTSVYFAYPGSSYEVEVYDPSPARARQLVLSGQISAVGSTSGPTQATVVPPKAVTVSQLRALQKSLGHPIYWLGSRVGVTYELRQTSDGRAYIRYLPAGAKVGDRSSRTTVGTYPLSNATAAVKGIAKRTGTKTFAVAGGGIAAVDGSHPTSVYVAFPGSNYEIEIFDPSAARAHQLVSSGRVAPVG
jgi:hypothetical protein